MTFWRMPSEYPHPTEEINKWMDIAAPTVAVTLSVSPLSRLSLFHCQFYEFIPRNVESSCLFHRRIAPVRFLSWTTLHGGAAAVAVTMVFIKGLRLTRKTSMKKPLALGRNTKGLHGFYGNLPCKIYWDPLTLTEVTMVWVNGKKRQFWVGYRLQNWLGTIRGGGGRPGWTKPWEQIHEMKISWLMKTSMLIVEEVKE